MHRIKFECFRHEHTGVTALRRPTGDSLLSIIP
jgi:hypothetical protein